MLSVLALTLAFAAVDPHPTSIVTVAQLKYAGGNWNPRPHAIRRLSFEIEKRTSIAAAHEALPVMATEARLADTPFLYWTGQGAMSALDDASVLALRRYVKAGGTLFVDCVDEEFEQSVRRELKRVFPDATLAHVPDDHVLYKTFYLLSSSGGRVLRRPSLEGVLQEDRLVVVLSGNDHGGAWSRDDFGRYEFEVEPGGESQRETAFRFGINLVMYVLCLDYKEDQVHIPFIMRRRK